MLVKSAASGGQVECKRMAKWSAIAPITGNGPQRWDLL
ncbi:hypothetical protein C4K38_2851 [Pseudomonas chlororaphis subsp. piscium]|nr:hypothetical protein C4K38_2851 [Pseudomonas chlororaphis subsp. piscium]